MDRIINTALVLIDVYLWLFKKYGLAMFVTRKACRHAAVGRAKWTAFWNTPVRDHRDLVHSASDLIAKLREERARAASIAFGNAHAKFAIEFDRANPGQYAMAA